MTFWSSDVQTDATINTFSGTTKVTASPHPTTTWSTRRRTQLLEQRWPATSQANRTLSPSGRSMPWTPAPLWRHAITAMAWPALSFSTSGEPSHSSPSPLRSTPRLSRRAQRLGCRLSLSPDDDADPFLVLGWLGSRITTWGLSVIILNIFLAQLWCHVASLIQQACLFVSSGMLVPGWLRCWYWIGEWDYQW